VQLQGVGVRYGRRAPWVLRDVALELPAGALVQVTGSNGAGKSSLLRVLAGVLRPGAGSVRGRPAVVGWAPERFPAEQQVAAGSYLLAQARVRGLGAAASRQAVDREAARLHLTPLLGTPLPELSKGSAQKVGLAQALLVPPGLLLLDEPWSGLDADARRAVPGLVREVLDDGGRVVVTDHHRQAGALAPDRLWHVGGGRVEPGPPATAGGTVRVEVDVAAEDAAGLLADLRGRGLDPRTR
jgi:ABC-2 type transport system ATP-binding protein